MTEEFQNQRERRPSAVGGCGRIGSANTPVTFSNICKEVMLRDKIFRRNWSEKFYYLTGEFFHKVLAEECKQAKLPADTFQQKPKEDLIQQSPIALEPSPYFPRTSSAMIGLRSSLPQCNLEFTGRMYIPPKWSIEPPVTLDDLEATQQRFIFLG